MVNKKIYQTNNTQIKSRRKNMYAWNEDAQVSAALGIKIKFLSGDHIKYQGGTMARNRLIRVLPRA